MGAVTLTDAFPTDVLAECDSALMLFCAAFHGRNDCVWVERAALQHVTAVDLDQTKLDGMRDIYPEHWNFVCADAFEYEAEPHDLVCADPFSNHSERVLKMIPRWCDIARKFVVVTAFREPDEFPSGWRCRDLVWRSDLLGGCYWLVLEKT